MINNIMNNPRNIEVREPKICGADESTKSLPADENSARNSSKRIS